jgi:hypothetical protein
MAAVLLPPPTNPSKMKKYLLFILFSTGLLFRTLAQDGEGNAPAGNRLEALKIAYLTKKLDLSTEEAQRFWPIYNKYMEEIRGIRADQKQKNLPEIEVEDRILNVRKKYNNEFTKALSPEKVNTFFRSEKDFGNFIQRELQERKMNRMQQQQLRRSFKQ